MVEYISWVCSSLNVILYLLLWFSETFKFSLQACLYWHFFKMLFPLFYITFIKFYSASLSSCWHLKTVPEDSSVGIALGYGLDDRGSSVRFPAGAENFSLHHRVQNGSGAHPASYPMGTGALSLGAKRPGLKLTTPPIRLHGVVLS
jgi:hypothetical protein